MIGSPFAVPLFRASEYHARTYESDDQIIRDGRILAPVRPRMQAAGLQCLKLQIAVASPDPQTRAFPGTELSQKIRSPKCTRHDITYACT